MVGFSYLLTLEVAFSLWFFFLFFKLQCLVGSMLGFLITKGPGVKWTAYSFSAAQEAGACLTLGGFALFKARRHIKQLFLSGFGRSSPQSDVQEEPMPAGLTVIGLIGGVLLLIYLSVLMGMSLVFAVLFVIFSVGVFVALTWQIINGGIPFINPSFSPQSFFLTTLGTARMTPFNNNVAVHAAHRLNLAPERVYDAECDEWTQGSGYRESQPAQTPHSDGSGDGARIARLILFRAEG